MSRNEMNNELSQTLAELCDDLFSVTECDDNARAILLSLATLGSGFPRAQKIIGRLLAQRRTGKGSMSSSYLSQFANRFLYHPLTSKTALGLLAIISHRNVRNQTRIVQEITGVRILRHQSKKSSDLVLFTLTIPLTIKETYKAWKQRHRTLANHRIPCGQPPTHDGIPMPCYCNSCLGADQFLPTWQQHFHDLSRWANESSNQESNSSEPSARSLSSAAFYSLYLQNHRMFAYSPQELSEASSKAVVYYFAPEIDSASDQPPFDPLRHLSAIEIAEEVDVPVKRSRTKGNNSQEKEVELTPAQTVSDNDVLVESVVLLETQLTLRSCHHLVEKENKVDPVEAKRVGLSAFLELVESKEEPVNQPQLVNMVTEAVQSDQLSTLEAHILTHIFEFCDSEDLISVPSLRATLSDNVTLPSPDDQKPTFETSENAEEEVDTQNECECDDIVYDVIVIAQIQASELVIQCIDRSDGVHSSEMTAFRAVVHQQEILADFDQLPLKENQFALLYIEESALLAMLSHCVVCQCPDAHEVTKPNILLSRVLLDETAAVIADPEPTEAIPKETQAVASSATTLLPGLSAELQQILQLASAAFESEESFTADTVHFYLDTLTSVIRKCNERITFLASNTSRSMKAIPNAHRSAAMIRCRLCRDHLIRLSKTLKLQQSSDHSRVPPKRIARMKALVRQTLQSVVEQSESFEVWEIPDERVAKLHLNRQLWASGFPDVAFYQQSERVARENRSQQRYLSDRLRSKKSRKSIQ